MARGYVFLLGIRSICNRIYSCYALLFLFVFQFCGHLRLGNIIVCLLLSWHRTMRIFVLSLSGKPCVEFEHVEKFVIGGSSISVFWRRVMIGPPNVEDLKQIVKESYPSLAPIAEKLIGLLHSTLQTCSD